jgi:uncharacterized RDD family membrane protein YckC
MSTSPWETIPPPATEAPRAGDAATWGSRVGATLLDNILILVVVVLGFIVLAIGGGLLGPNELRIVLAVFGLLYAILMLAYHGGQTVGKEVVHVRVVAEDGSPVGLGRAAGRELLKAFFTILVLPYLLDVLWPLWQPENRALHDLAAGTRVVKAPRRPPAGYYPADEA